MLVDKKNDLKKVNFFLILAYIIFLAIEYIFTNFIAKVSYNNSLIHIVVFLFLLVLSIPFVFQRVSDLSLKAYYFKNETKIKTLVFVISGLLVFLLIVALYVMFPERRMTHDIEVQFNEARTGSYNDWHPVLQTIMAITLPAKIFKTEAAIYICQAVFFGIAFGYMCETIVSYGKNLYYLVVPYICILVSPYTFRLVTIPQKDVSFAIVGIFLMTAMVRIYFTDGKWIKKWYNSVFVVVLLVLASIFRHNGILFTVPLIPLLIIYLKKDIKRVIVIIVAFIVLFAGIKGPLYSAIEVEKPDYRVTEETGLLLNIIACTMKETPDAVSQETRDFAYSVCSQDIWNRYPYGDFNVLKFTLCDLKEIEKAGYSGVVKATVDCLIKSPKAAICGFLRTTDFVYGFNAVYQGMMMYVMLAFGLGFMTLIILYILIAKLNFKSKDSLLRTAYSLPIIIYSVLTMLLLTSNVDSKLFYITQCTAPLMVFMALVSRDTNEQTS